MSPVTFRFQMLAGVQFDYFQINLCLPAGWKTTLPKADQEWVSKALFTWNKRGGVD